MGPFLGVFFTVLGVCLLFAPLMMWNRLNEINRRVEEIVDLMRRQISRSAKPAIGTMLQCPKCKTRFPVTEGADCFCPKCNSELCFA